MADLQGLVLFPGAEQVLSARFTLGQGITPSVATIEIQPQADFLGEGGTLSFVFGPVEIDFPDCRVNTASFRYSESGLIWQLSIWDRRWKWAFGQVYGIYNERLPSILPGGSIDATTLATPQQLCSYCLDAMGEVNYDVSQVPNDSHPEVNWEAENPARALAALADQLGCRVVLRLNNTVAVARAGVGALLPTLAVMQDGLVFKPPQRPDTITVICARTRYQVDFLLEAVGKDLGGVIKPINQLSYKPAAGWGATAGASPPLFSDVTGFELDPLLPAAVQATLRAQYVNPRELAMQTVFRWYRISMTAIDNPRKTPQIPGLDPDPDASRLDYLWQILPIEDVQVEGFYDTNRVWFSRPVIIWGQFASSFFYWTNAQGGSYYDRPFSINKDEGIVEFDEAVFQFAANNTITPASLGIRVAVSVRAPDTRSWYRHGLERPTSGVQWGTQERVLRHEELYVSYIPTYDANHRVTAVNNNQADVDTAANYALDAAELDYQYQTPQERTYMGLIAIDLDGAISQVTWTVGPSGATTRASRNTEWDPVTVSYAERRQWERLQDIAQKFPDLLSQVRRPERIGQR